MSFTFKKFHVNDDQCAMKVGTDSILLGSWANIGPGQRILDIGSGCGLLGLMAAQRSEGLSQVVGVEIDTPAVVQAQQNVTASPWPEAVVFQQGDINFFADHQPFDRIITNPPYFVDCLPSQLQNRRLARHADRLTPEQLIASVIRLLADDGQFYVILPYAEGQLFMAEAGAAGLHLSQLNEVRSKQGKAIHRLMMGFVKQSGIRLATQNLAVYDENNQYSQEFIALTQDFYLNYG